MLLLSSCEPRPRPESWSFTGEPKQLWTWSESGNQLINQETGLPFTVAGFTEWKVDSSRQSDLLVTQYAGKVRKTSCFHSTTESCFFFI